MTSSTLASSSLSNQLSYYSATVRFYCDTRSNYFNMQSKLKIDSPMIMTGKVTNHFMICNLTINWDYNGAVIIIFDCFILDFEVA